MQNNTRLDTYELEQNIKNKGNSRNLHITCPLLTDSAADWKEPRDTHHGIVVAAASLVAVHSTPVAAAVAWLVAAPRSTPAVVAAGSIVAVVESDQEVTGCSVPLLHWEDRL